MASRQAAAERIRKFIDEYKKMRGLHPEMVYEIHAGDDHRQAAITIADLEALLAQPKPETTDDLPLWTNEELEKLADDHMAMDGATGVMFLGHLDFAHAVIAADRAHYARPTIQPVPVAERPWEREGWCDAEGRCWLHRPAEIPCRLANGTLYRWVLDTPCRDEEEPVHDTHSLPHHALPIPTTH
jgi:hypothetical protein